MNVKQWISRLMMVLLAVLTSACTVIPLSSLWQLRGFDFAKFDGRQLRVLLHLPGGVQATPEALRIGLRLHRGGGSTEVVSETLVLRPQAADAKAALPAAPQVKGHWVWLAMGEDDVRRLDALRAKGAAWREADGKAEGRKLETEVSPQLCRLGSAPLNAGQVRLSAWVRWQAEQAPVLLLDQASAKEMDEKTASEPVPACGTLAR